MMRPGFARTRATVVGYAITGVGACVLSLGVAGFASSTSVAAAAAPNPSPASPAASAAASWLIRQLDAGQGLMPGLSAGTPDVGLASDTLLSLVAAGQRQEPGFVSSVAAVAGHLSGYATFPAGRTTARLAGPLAKTLFLAQVAGADATSFGGIDLPATVRSLLTSSGPNAGRFSDHGTGSDTSNGFSQSFAILGLLREPGGVPASAISFLLKQQCPSGAFRLFYDTPGGCRDNGQADPDATSVTIQALSAVLRTNPGSAAIATARSSAAQWLASRQQPDGGLGGAGPTSGENVNTTALAAVAFREMGLTAAADAAQRYVSGLQLTGGPDAGAVAYDPAALSPIGPAGTIPRTDEDQWRRSTSQAILAFGLPGYDMLPALPGSPITPVTPTPSPPHQTIPTPSPVTTPTATQHLPGSTAPGADSPAAADDFTDSVDAADPDDSGDQWDPADSEDLSDEGDDGSFADDPADDFADDSDQSEADDAADPAPSAANENPSPEAAKQATVSPKHPSAQASVASHSADGGIPSWVWIVVAAAGGIGGGVVVLRVQARRARS